MIWPSSHTLHVWGGDLGWSLHMYWWLLMFIECYTSHQVKHCTYILLFNPLRSRWSVDRYFLHFTELRFREVKNHKGYAASDWELGSLVCLVRPFLTTRLLLVFSEYSWSPDISLLHQAGFRIHSKWRVVPSESDLSFPPGFSGPEKVY